MGYSSCSRLGGGGFLAVAPEGRPFIIGSALATALAVLFGFYVLALFFLACTAFVSFFFRDPDRMVPEKDGLVVSPADGRVVEVKLVEESEISAGKMLKISVFMSVFNVHVNRMPFSGRVADVSYHPGKFFSADLDKASRVNERNAVTLDINGGQKLIVVQVAGLIARRIVCRVREGDLLRRGERFGMICFGSRLDVYLPAKTLLAVSVGDKVFAGTSVLGALS